MPCFYSPHSPALSPHYMEKEGAKYGAEVKREPYLDGQMPLMIG